MKNMRWIEAWTDLIVAAFGTYLTYSIIAAAFLPFSRISWLVSIIGMGVSLFILIHGWIRFCKNNSMTPAAAVFSKAGSLFVGGGWVAWFLILFMFPITLHFSITRAIDFALAAFFIGLGLQTTLIVCNGVKEAFSLIKNSSTNETFRSAPYGLAISCLLVCIALYAVNLVGLYRIFYLVREPVMNFMMHQ